ncbi:MAG: MFS transporter [Pseudomonadota bacterium]
MNSADQAQSRMVQVLIVAYFCISLGLNNGFILGGLTAFDQGFLEQLNVSVAELKLRDTVTLAVTGVFAFLTGALVDKLGALRVLIIGHILFMTAFGLLSQAGNINTIYGAQAILGICQLCSGYLVCVIAISRLLPSGKGLAIGLMMASTSLANALLPSLNAGLIENYGPRTSLLLIAAAGIPLIVGALWVVGRKQISAEGTQSDAQTASGPTLAQAVRRLDFWALICVACLSFFSFIGIVTNLALYAGAEPLNDPSAAGKLFFALFIISLIMQSAAGWLADRFALRPIHMTGLLCMSIAAAGLGYAASSQQALWWLVLMGFGWGLNYVFVQISIPARFGGAHLGRIFGVIVVAEALAAAAGPALFGQSLDRFGSYQPILLVCTGLLLVSMVSAGILHRPAR